MSASGAPEVSSFANPAARLERWRSGNRLTHRFHARFASALGRLQLKVDAEVRTSGHDDLAWGRVQPTAASFLESVVADHRWLRALEAPAGSLPAIACALHPEHLGEDLLITLGLGGSEVMPSHRLIQTIDPALALAERLRLGGFGAPCVHIFKADAVAAIINRFDVAAMAAVSAATLAYIEAYVRAFYPELAGRVSLCTDRPDAVKRLVDGVIRPLSANVPVLPEMAALGRNRSSPADAMIYGLCHAFHMGALLPLEGGWGGLWADNVSPRQPDAVLCVGGRPEQNFVPVMNLGVALAAEAGDWRKPQRAHLITRLGQKPAYLPLEQEPGILEPLLHSYVEVAARDSLLGPDWRATLADPRLPDLLEFANSWRR